MKNKKIFILYGGASSEREVSLRSGKAMHKALIDAGYADVTLFDAVPQNMHELLSARPDICLLALHGKYGEDGAIQGYLEMLAIPYTGSGVGASAIAFDKYLAKLCFLSEKIPTSPFCTGAPCVVKPAREGSAVGVSIAMNDADYATALALARKYDKKTVIEKFIEGKELTVTIMNGEVLPIIHIKPRSGVYDYESKYTPGATEYLFDTGLAEEEERLVKNTAFRAYSVLGCEGVARVDIIYDGVTPYVLEVNTLPGMTETSNVPKSAERAGIPFVTLLEKMMEHGLSRAGRRNDG